MEQERDRARAGGSRGCLAGRRLSAGCAPPPPPARPWPPTLPFAHASTPCMGRRLPDRQSTSAPAQRNLNREQGRSPRLMCRRAHTPVRTCVPLPPPHAGGVVMMLGSEGTGTYAAVERGPCDRPTPCAPYSGGGGAGRTRQPTPPAASWSLPPYAPPPALRWAGAGARAAPSPPSSPPPAVDGQGVAMVGARRLDGRCPALCRGSERGGGGVF